jgi:hypothetical protein
MTHSTINTEAENSGSVSVVYHTIDITSLDAAGSETYDPESETNLAGADRYGIAVRGQENTGYEFAWDHINGALTVVNVSDGTDVASGIDVGEVVLEVIGA